MYTDDIALQAKHPRSSAQANQQLRELVETDAELAATLARALLAALPAHDQANRAQAVRTLGVAQVKAGRYDLAQDTLAEALELTGDEASLEARADILNHLSVCNFYLDSFENALAFGLEGLSISRTVGARLLEASALHIIGWVYDNFGLYQDALESFLAELALLSELDIEGARRAFSLNGAAVAYRQLQDYGKAATYLESALAIARSSGEVRAQALTLSNLGALLDDRRDYVQALQYYRESLALYQTLDDPRELARLWLSMGQALHRLNDLEAAKEAFTKALAQLELRSSAVLAIDTHLNLSYLSYQMLEPAQGLEHLYAARALTDEDAAPADAYRVHRALAEAYKMQGEFRRALAHFETFHALKERVQREADLRKAKGQLLQFDVERLQHEREMYRLKHVELARAYSQLEAISVRDPLTNLHNRHYLNQQLAREVTRAQRYRRPISLMLCDIDNFKRVNDSFSHAVGDEVLKIIAEILIKRTRATDVRARLGGEELVAVFPETALGDAQAICEKIRQAVAGYPWAAIHPDLAVTLSVGVAELGEDDTPASLMARADAKMYEAKNLGKNRVAV